MITGKIRKEARLNPWVEGFQPPSKCPKCKQVNMLTFTGKRTEQGHHIYRCTNCNASVGTPTIYAFCEQGGQNIVVEKDIFYTPCFHGKCPDISPKDGKFCEFFVPIQEGEADEKFRRLMDDSMVKTKIVEDQPQTTPTELGHGGISTSLYEKLRKERLRKLKEERR